MPHADDVSTSAYLPEDDYSLKLRDELEHSFREFDKLVVTISAGILAFSVAFFNQNVVGHRGMWALMVSWSFLLLAVLSVAVSLWTEQAHKKALLANWGRRNPNDDSVPVAAQAREARLFRIVGWINWSSGGTFLLGVIFLVVFLFSNTGGAK